MLSALHSCFHKIGKIEMVVVRAIITVITCF